MDRIGWSSTTSLSKSKIVRSSYIWLFIVPLAAKFLSSLEDPMPVMLLGGIHNLELSLPFSWTYLFYAACAFSAANLLYAVFCPKILSEYKSFKEYHEQGRTPNEICTAYKQLMFDNNGKIRDEELRSQASKFSNEYGKRSAYTLKDDIEDKAIIDALSTPNFSFAGTAEIPKEAFYLTQNLANDANPWALMFSFILYGVGLVFVSLIVVQNFNYVVNMTGN